MSKQRYYYALVKKTTGKLFLESGYLPIFWLRSVANEKASGFNGTKVKKIKAQDLQELLYKTK